MLPMDSFTTGSPLLPQLEPQEGIVETSPKVMYSIKARLPVERGYCHNNEG